MNTTPEGLPTLAKGAHQPGDGKACVMEYVALLNGESWTDHPECTHPVLAEVSRSVNDRMADENRHLLVPLIGRLFGTSATGSLADRKHLAVGLAIFSADRVAHLVNPKYRANADAARGAARAWYENPTEENRKAANSAAYADYADSADSAASWRRVRDESMVESLSALIDEYDHLTGRTQSREVTPAELTDLRDRVAGLAVSA